MSSMEAMDTGEAYCKIKGQNWMLSDEEKNVHREGATATERRREGKEDGMVEGKREGGKKGKEMIALMICIHFWVKPFPQSN